MWRTVPTKSQRNHHPTHRAAASSGVLKGNDHEDDTTSPESFAALVKERVKVVHLMSEHLSMCSEVDGLMSSAQDALQVTLESLLMTGRSVDPEASRSVETETAEKSFVPSLEQPPLASDSMRQCLLSSSSCCPCFCSRRKKIIVSLEGYGLGSTGDTVTLLQLAFFVSLFSRIRSFLKEMLPVVDEANVAPKKKDEEGSILHCRGSKEQQVKISIRNKACVCDPIMTELDKAVCQKLGVDVQSKNQKGARKISHHFASVANESNCAAVGGTAYDHNDEVSVGRRCCTCPRSNRQKEERKKKEKCEMEEKDDDASTKEEVTMSTTVIEEEEVEVEEVLIAFMPHCSKALYNNLVASNWIKQEQKGEVEESRKCVCSEIQFSTLHKKEKVEAEKEEKKEKVFECQNLASLLLQQHPLQRLVLIGNDLRQYTDMCVETASSCQRSHTAMSSLGETSSFETKEQKIKRTNCICLEKLLPFVQFQGEENMLASSDANTGGNKNRKRRKKNTGQNISGGRRSVEEGTCGVTSVYSSHNSFVYGSGCTVSTETVERAFGGLAVMTVAGSAKLRRRKTGPEGGSSETERNTQKKVEKNNTGDTEEETVRVRLDEVVESVRPKFIFNAVEVL